MAKLKHLQDLIPRIAQVDEGRARVLVMKARASGHFTTGGRGVNAPDVVPADAVSALLLCLHMDAPTEAGEGVADLKSLPLDHVKFNPGDGTFRDVNPEVFPTDSLPAAFGKALPATLADALAILFSRADSFENRWDKIEFSRHSQRQEVKLYLADKDYTRNDWDEVYRAWEFVFQPETLASYDELGCWINKTIHGEALRALRDLVKGGS